MTVAKDEFGLVTLTREQQQKTLDGSYVGTDVQIVITGPPAAFMVEALEENGLSVISSEALRFQVILTANGEEGLVKVLKLKDMDQSLYKPAKTKHAKEGESDIEEDDDPDLETQSVQSLWKGKAGDLNFSFKVTAADPEKYPQTLIESRRVFIAFSEGTEEDKRQAGREPGQQGLDQFVSPDQAKKEAEGTRDQLPPDDFGTDTPKAERDGDSLKVITPPEEKPVPAKPASEEDRELEEAFEHARETAKKLDDLLESEAEEVKQRAKEFAEGEGTIESDPENGFSSPPFEEEKKPVHPGKKGKGGSKK
jgi:hypothetical protein